jgi:hypothetical protein
MEKFERIEFEVIGGMCRLQFDPVISCGPDDDCNPGIGFSLISDAGPAYARDGKYYSGMGVFSRSDAARLRDMLDAFLVEWPVGGPPHNAQER